MTEHNPEEHEDARPPLQFGLRTMLIVTSVVAMLFGTLRWLEVSTRASVMILVILVVSVLAALALVASIAGARDD